jgi:hypothetical protein
MADKILVDGNTATYTTATRTITSAEMSAVFDADDATYKRQIIFRTTTAAYRGTILTYVSASSVTLASDGTLPSGNATLTDIVVLDLDEDHSYADYKAAVQALIKDSDAKLSTTAGGDIETLLARAVREYGRDVPEKFSIKKKVAGDGTAEYVLTTLLGSLWKPGHSQVRSVEYPYDEDEPSLLKVGKDWIMYDDGTAQDKTNLILRFINDEPAATDYFVVEYNYQIQLPSTGSKNFPDTDEHFNNITLLAAAYACQALASVYAQNISPNFGGDIVNFSTKSDNYRGLAKMFMARYRESVFGNEDTGSTIKPAMADKRIEKTNQEGKPFIFDRHRNR